MKRVSISEKIYEKEFTLKSYGFDCHEVDNFIDEINFEVSKLEREIESLKDACKNLEATKNALEQKNRDLQLENSNLKATNNVSSTTHANFSNIQLLNRISSLETNVKKILDKLNDQ